MSRARRLGASARSACAVGILTQDRASKLGVHVAEKARELEETQVDQSMKLVDPIDNFLHQPRPQPHRFTQFYGRRLRQGGRRRAFGVSQRAICKQSMLSVLVSTNSSPAKRWVRSGLTRATAQASATSVANKFCRNGRWPPSHYQRALWLRARQRPEAGLRHTVRRLAPTLLSTGESNPIFHSNIVFGPAQPNGIAVEIDGRYDALEPIIRSYGADATRVYFPYPTPLSSASMPHGPAMREKPCDDGNHVRSRRTGVHRGRVSNVGRGY